MEGNTAGKPTDDVLASTIGKHAPVDSGAERRHQGGDLTIEASHYMEGAKGHPAVQYAVRITFGIVHGVILTLFSFGLALLFPSLTHFLFGLFGCIVAPMISLILTIFCNACVEYVSESSVTATAILKTCWIPPLGVFATSLLILPLEMMPSLGFSGPINTLVATSVLANFVVTALLQIYAAKGIQAAGASSSSSDPPT